MSKINGCSQHPYIYELVILEMGHDGTFILKTHVETNSSPEHKRPKVWGYIKFRDKNSSLNSQQLMIMTNTRYLHGNMQKSHKTILKPRNNQSLYIYLMQDLISTPNSSLNNIQNTICFLLEALQDNKRGQFNKI